MEKNCPHNTFSKSKVKKEKSIFFTEKESIVFY